MIYRSGDKLSIYFKHWEVSKSYTASRNNINNTPNSEVMHNAEKLAVNVLDIVRAHFNVPLKVNSWYRGEALEQVIARKGYLRYCRDRSLDVNEASWSNYFKRKSHPKGQAADIEFSSVDNDVLYQWIKDNLKFDQLIREFPVQGDPRSGWVHVSYSTNNRNQSFTIK